MGAASTTNFGMHRQVVSISELPMRLRPLSGPRVQVQTLLSHFLAGQPQASGFPPLDLSFPILDMEVMARSSSRRGGHGTGRGMCFLQFPAEFLQA